jgi:hypothetical protein
VRDQSGHPDSVLGGAFYDGRETLSHRRCGWCKFVVIDDRAHLFRVDGGEVRSSLLLIDDDVARQQDPELGFGLERGMGEGWVTGSEDQVGLPSTPSLCCLGTLAPVAARSSVRACCRTGT